MKGKLHFYLVGILTAFLLLISCQQPGGSNMNTSTTFDTRVDSVLQLMTLEEKIGQLNQITGLGELTGPLQEANSSQDLVKEGKVGSMLNVTGSRYTREMQRIAVEESRLGIPLVFGYDVIHGYRTIFPVPLGEASSWDLEAIQKAARVAATEAASAGQHWTFAPMVDIARDPRWGRIMEGSGEDPYLGSRIAEARVKGFQGDNLEAINTVAACIKHYAAYGAAIGGRDYNTVDMSDVMLHQVYLPPYKAAVDAGAATLMSSFNDFNGVPASGNKYLLHDILRSDWNFKGMVVSDWASISEMITHGFVADKYHAGYESFTAGVDMDMQGNVYITQMKKLIEDGKISEKQLNDAVKRVLQLKFKLGLFDDPYKYCDEQREKAELLSASNREAARDVARKSMVLLKNKSEVLPLNGNIKSIALIGPLADDKDNLIGTWSAHGVGSESVSLFDGLKEALPGVTINYIKGCEIIDDDASGIPAAVNTADRSDLIILAVGESAMMTGEALSRAHIDLPGVQTELFEALKKTGKKIVVVLFNGRPLAIPEIAENADAVLEAWWPGTEGGHAIADILTGKYNPSGKLPVTFPYTTGQIPIYYNHKNTGRPGVTTVRYTSKYIDAPIKPLYPFGYGLSYSSFEYSAISLNKDTITGDEALEITVEVTNTGKVTGTETVQLYIRDLVASITQPVKELKGFTRVTLEPGAKETVSFKLNKNDLKFYKDGNWINEPGEFNVFVGTNSDQVKNETFYLK
jgi:beta-glucosidase